MKPHFKVTVTRTTMFQVVPHVFMLDKHGAVRQVTKRSMTVLELKLLEISLNCQV